MAHTASTRFYILAVVIAILLLLSTHVLGEVTVQCCDIYRSLHQYVAVRGGTIPPECVPASCSHNNLMHKLLSETRQMLVGDALAVSDALDVTLSSRNMTSSAVADWIMLALLGRFVTKPSPAEDNPQHDYLEYDAISGQIIVKAAQCQVQQTVYEVMLVISIVSIIGLMTTQVMVKHVLADYTIVSADTAESRMSGPYQTTPCVRSQTVAFEPLRWRLGKPT